MWGGGSGAEYAAVVGRAPLTLLVAAHRRRESHNRWSIIEMIVADYMKMVPPA